MVVVLDTVSTALKRQHQAPPCPQNQLEIKYWWTLASDALYVALSDSWFWVSDVSSFMRSAC